MVDVAPEGNKVRSDEIDWAAVARDMDRGWLLLNARVWSNEAQKWVLRDTEIPKRNLDVT